jgi:ribokinase
MTFLLIKLISYFYLGAGDCFVGSFGHFYSQGKTILQSVRAAVALASLSVQLEGTQSSYPTKFPSDFEF